MVTATEAGKQAMNGKPAVSLQKDPVHKTNSVTGEWAYQNPYMHKTYCYLMEFGDIPLDKVKVAIRAPEMGDFAYHTVRDEMLAAGKLLTPQEATENRKHRADKKLREEIERVTEQGQAKESAKIKPTVTTQLVGPELHAQTVQSAGTRKGTVMEEALKNATSNPLTGVKDRKVSPEGDRLRTLLRSYTLSELKSLNIDDFKRQKGWYNFKDANFHNHKRTVIGQFERAQLEKTTTSPQPQLSTAPPPVPPKPETERQSATKIILTVPIDDVPPEFQKILKAKLVFVFGEMAKDAENLQIVTLMDPAQLEVRKTIYY